MNAPALIWQRSVDRITCVANGGDVIFDDSVDHWQNAVCRLLGWNDDTVRAWIEASVAAAPAGRKFSSLCVDEKITALATGARCLFDGRSESASGLEPQTFAGLNVLDQTVDRIWVRGMRDDPGVAVVGSGALGHGILVRTPENGGGAVPPTVYEEDYFEGGIHGTGYGDYRAQMAWRLEKSARQWRQLEGIALWAGRPFSRETRVLDVGSGYGYFRKVAADHGYAHVGVDVSRHAAEVAHHEFGFETFVGSLAEFAARGSAGFDLITLFDTIEHVTNPVTELRAAATLLNPEGLLAVRTPNLEAVELEVFGRFYHSLKMEHVHYFSGRSICHGFEMAGLIPRFLTTEAHLLTGVLGEAAVQTHARTLRGSDLLAVGQRPH